MYNLVLFLHVISGIGIFVALAIEAGLVGRLHRSRTREEESRAVAAFSIMPWLGAPIVLIVLLSGFYLATTGSYWRAGWPFVALVGLILLAVFGAVFGSRPAQSAQRLLRAGRPIPPALAGAMRSPVRRGSLWARTLIAVGIVYLMTLHPDRSASFVVLAIAVLLALVTLILSRSWQGGAEIATSDL